MSSTKNKGHFDLAVLKILSAGELHGYDIVRKLGEIESGALASGEGTIYPLLIKLESEGLLKSRWMERRRYYSITKSGLKALDTRSQEWFRLTGAMQALLAMQMTEVLA